MIRRLSTVTLALLLILGLTVVPPANESATADSGVIYVDSNNTGGPWDGTETHPYQTIQSGVDAAVSGDTVSVAAGTYYENIFLKEGITVHGEGSSVTTLDGGDIGPTVTANHLLTKATIDGFNITSGLRAGVSIEESHVEITNNSIRVNNGAGVSVSGEAVAYIANNMIADNADYGIFMDIDSEGIILSNRILENGSWGVDVFRATLVNNVIANNEVGGIRATLYPTIYNNTVAHNLGEGVSIGTSLGAYAVLNNIIWGNKLEDLTGGTPDFPTSAAYSIIGTGNTAGFGNISEQPLFVDPISCDYRLRYHSPGIDRGIDEYPVNFAVSTTDIEGNPRCADGDGDGIATTDMGATEVTEEQLNDRGRSSWWEFWVDLRPGDILIENSPGVVSFFSGDEWVHAGIYAGGGKVWEAGGLSGGEIVDDRVQLADIREWDYYPSRDEDVTGYFSRPVYCIARFICPPFTRHIVRVLRVDDASDDQRWEVVEFAEDQKDKGYELSIISKDGRRNAPNWYCSELVWAAYLDQGIDLDPNVGTDAVFPQDIYDHWRTRAIGGHNHGTPWTNTPAPETPAPDVSADSDGDGLTDKQEVLGWDITYTYPEVSLICRGSVKENDAINGSGHISLIEETEHVTSDPLSINSDDDEVNDYDEFNIGLNPRSADTNGDGINDQLDCSTQLDLVGAEFAVHYGGSSGSEQLAFNSDGDFTFNNQYCDEGNYNITVSISYCGQSSAIATTDVQVENVAPSVHLEPEVTVRQGDNLEITGRLRDPGCDHWTITIDYGDGTDAQQLKLISRVSRYFDIEHIYSDIGKYVITAIVEDNDGGVGEGKIAVNVVGNQPPTANDDEYTTTEGRPRSWSAPGVLGNDTDPESDNLVIIDVDSSGTIGTVKCNQNGSFDYDQNGKFDYLGEGESATDQFYYTISDGRGGSDTGTVTIIVTGLNNPPVAQATWDYYDDGKTLIKLDGSSSYDPDQGDSIVSWEWDLDGDGKFDDAIGETATMSLPDSGNLRACLCVTDEHGKFATVTLSEILGRVAGLEPESPPESEVETAEGAKDGQVDNWVWWVIGISIPVLVGTTAFWYLRRNRFS